jgi:hypothetical protein
MRQSFLMHTIVGNESRMKIKSYWKFERVMVGTSYEPYSNRNAVEPRRTYFLIKNIKVKFFLGSTFHNSPGFKILKWE